MFQRLKGAIDSRIAEEQARQKALANLPLSRPLSPSRRTESRRDYYSKSKSQKRPGKGFNLQRPDPLEFEKAFIIDDEDEITVKGAHTEAVPDQSIIMSEINSAPMVEERGTSDAVTSTSPASPRLSQEVRTKLRRLERLETKYQELLRSYRIAHARSTSIEVFEKQLKEYTPLSTITDPDAFVEYLNELKLKGDIVMEEFKRVSSDRDEYKKKYEESQSKLSSYCENLSALKNSSTQTELGNFLISDVPMTTLSSSSPVSSTICTPSALKTEEATETSDSNKEIFSFDNGISLLKTEIKSKTAEIEDLKSKVGELEKEINSLNTSTSIDEGRKKVSDDLEKTNIVTSKDQSNLMETDTQHEKIQNIEKDLDMSNSQISILETELETQKAEYESKVSLCEERFANQEKDLEIALKESLAANQKSEARCKNLIKHVEILEQARETNLKLFESLKSDFNNLISVQQVQDSESHEQSKSTAGSKESNSVSTSLETNKKKGKKRRKGGVTPLSLHSGNENCPPFSPKIPNVFDIRAKITRIESEIRNNCSELAESKQISNVEVNFPEDFEERQELLLSISQDQLKLLEENRQFREKIVNLEKDVEGYKADLEDKQMLEVNFRELTTKCDELRLKSATLEIDLRAAQQLAVSRYEDITNLRERLQKIQPELNRLHAENTDLKKTKEELLSLTSELKRSESKERDLRTDIANLKKQVADSQTEIHMLRDKLVLENNMRLRAEDQQRVAQRDMRNSEAEKIQYAAASEKSASSLEKLQKEADNLRSQVRDLAESVSNLNTKNKRLGEESELRGSQCENSQALLTSMRDQLGEMAMQLKEAEAQSDSLSEELSDVQRLLSERTREGETMRRLLADVDNRSEAQLRELQESLEAAIKERDLAEDRASTVGRRRARELDKIKTRLHELEQDLQRSVEDKVRLERGEKEWKQNFETLKVSSDNLAKEVEDTRTAMNQLRNALEGSEKAVKLAQKQKLDMKRALDESNQRHDKLQKEYKALNLKVSRPSEGGDRHSLEGKAVKVSKSDAAVDYVYLKTIMLQFLEHKDRSVQESLVKTVLKQLLKFDTREQERWIAAISTN